MCERLSIGKELRFVFARELNFTVRCSISLNRRAFWIASNDCAAKVCKRSIVDLRKEAGLSAAHA